MDFMKDEEEGELSDIQIMLNNKTVNFKNGWEKAKYCAQKSLLLFQKRLQIPLYNKENILKSLPYSVLKHYFPSATPRSYSSFVKTPPYVVDLIKSCYFPAQNNTIYDSILMFLNQCCWNIPEDGLHAMWRMGYDKYTDKIFSVVSVLGNKKNSRMNIKYRLWDTLPDPFLSTPIDEDLFCWSLDCSQTKILGTKEKKEAMLTFSGYWDDFTYLWFISTSVSTGILLFGKAPFYPNISDKDVVNNCGIEKVMEKSDEFGIGDEKYSWSLRMRTKKMFRNRPDMKKVMQDERPTVEIAVGKLKDYRILVGPFRKHKDKFEMWFNALCEVVFLKTLYYPVRPYPKGLKEEHFDVKYFEKRFRGKIYKKRKDKKKKR